MKILLLRNTTSPDETSALQAALMSGGWVVHCAELKEHRLDSQGYDVMVVLGLGEGGCVDETMALLMSIHQQSAATPLLVVSQHAHPEVGKRCIEAGATEYVYRPAGKPIPLERLFAAIEHARKTQTAPE